MSRAGPGLRWGVSPPVIPLRPRKSFLEQLLMWAVDLMTQQWHHMDKKVEETAGLRALVSALGRMPDKTRFDVIYGIMQATKGKNL